VLGRAVAKVPRVVALTISCYMGSFQLQSLLCCLGWPLHCVSGHLRLDFQTLLLSRTQFMVNANIFTILKVKKHTSYMMTIEMSFIGSMCLLASTYRSPDGEAIRKYGFFHEWTFWTVVSTLCYSITFFAPLTDG
jgi:hypothetical protein